MKIDIQIDPSKFNRAISDLVAVSNKSAQQVLKDEMRLLVQRLVELTPPPHGRGSGKEAQKTGEGAVERDIKKVFTGTTAAYIQKYKKKFPNLKTSGRGNDLFENILNPQFHQEFRDKRGRVRRKGSRIIKIGKLEFSDKVHVPNSVLNSYIKTIQKHVGSAKAGWNAAAIKFKAANIPLWVRRHGTGSGSANESFSNTKSYVEAINRNKAIGSLDANARIVANALRGRERDIKTKIKAIMEYNSRKFRR